MICGPNYVILSIVIYLGNRKQSSTNNVIFNFLKHMTVDKDQTLNDSKRDVLSL
jgi:hypothetical protein